MFAGYGIPVADDIDELVGLLMIDRPYRASEHWLESVEEQFGARQLAYMTAAGERGILCRMKVEAGSRRCLKELDNPISRDIAVVLAPYINQLPAARFKVRWDDDARMWVSEFDI